MEKPKIKYSIQSKLMVSAITLSVVMFLGSFITVLSLNRNRVIIENIARKNVPSVSYLQILNHLITDSKLLIKTWVYIDKKQDTYDKKRLREIHDERFPMIANQLHDISQQWSPESMKQMEQILLAVRDSLFPQHKYIMEQLNSFEKYNDPMVYFEVEYLLEEENGEVMVLTSSILNKLDVLIREQESAVEEANVEMEESLQRFKNLIILLGIVMLAATFVVTFLLSRYIVQPLRHITNATTEVAGGNLAVKVEERGRDELAVLAYTFNQMTVNLKESHESLFNTNSILERERKKLQQANENIKASINYASRIQRAVLYTGTKPEDLPLRNFILLKPRDIVSGDFYWVKLTDNKLIIAAADCTGHGVPGAFMSMLAITFLNEIVSKETDARAADVLNILRDKIKTSLNQTGKLSEPKDGLDIAFCMLNLDTLQMEYAGAHNSLWVIGDNGLREYKADRMPIGIFHKERPFTNHVVPLERNERIYLFSDGFGDQIGGEMERKYRIAVLRELLLSFRGIPIEEQGELANNRFMEWKGGCEQVDDVLLMGFEI